MYFSFLRTYHRANFSLGLEASSEEKELLAKLFHPDNHDISVRPVKRSRHSLNVSLTLTLYQLIEIVSSFFIVFGQLQAKTPQTIKLYFCLWFLVPNLTSLLSYHLMTSLTRIQDVHIDSTLTYWQISYTLTYNNSKRNSTRNKTMKNNTVRQPLPPSTWREAIPGAVSIPLWTTRLLVFFHQTFPGNFPAVQNLGNGFEPSKNK